MRDDVDVGGMLWKQGAVGRQMRRLAARLATDDNYMAHSLALLCDDTVGERLGLSGDNVVRLRCCKEPIDIEGIQKVAAYVGCDAKALQRLLEGFRDEDGRLLPGRRLRWRIWGEHRA